MRLLTGILFMLAAAAAVAGTNANDREVRIGPFFSSDTDVDGNMRVRALGPVYETLLGFQPEPERGPAPTASWTTRT